MKTLPSFLLQTVWFLLLFVLNSTMVKAQNPDSLSIFYRCDSADSAYYAVTPLYTDSLPNGDISLVFFPLDSTVSRTFKNWKNNISQSYPLVPNTTTSLYFTEVKDYLGNPLLFNSSYLPVVLFHPDQAPTDSLIARFYSPIYADTALKISLITGLFPNENRQLISKSKKECVAIKSSGTFLFDFDQDGENDFSVYLDYSTTPMTTSKFCRITPLNCTIADDPKDTNRLPLGMFANVSLGANVVFASTSVVVVDMENSVNPGTPSYNKSMKGDYIFLEKGNQVGWLKISYGTCFQIDTGVFVNKFTFQPLSDYARCSARVNISDTEAENHFSAYPNPGKGLFYLNDEVTNQCPFTVLNNLGAEVQKGFVQDRQIDLGTLPAGLYFINLQAKHQNQMIKLVKE